VQKSPNGSVGYASLYICAPFRWKVILERISGSLMAEAMMATELLGEKRGNTL
jgi:hypothetical protein